MKLNMSPMLLHQHEHTVCFMKLLQSCTWGWDTSMVGCICTYSERDMGYSMSSCCSCDSVGSVTLSTHHAIHIMMHITRSSGETCMLAVKVLMSSYGQAFPCLTFVRRRGSCTKAVAETRIGSPEIYSVTYLPSILCNSYHIATPGGHAGCCMLLY